MEEPGVCVKEIQREEAGHNRNTQDNYYRFSGMGYFGAQRAWHFANQEKLRGVDPFVLFGGGA
jgi:hypothetical protein